MQVYEKFSEAETTNSARIGSLVTWKSKKKWRFSLHCCGFKTFRRSMCDKVERKRTLNPISTYNDFFKNQAYSNAINHANKYVVTK